VFSSHPSAFPMSLSVPCDLTRRRGDVFGPGVPVCLVSSHAETRRRGSVFSGFLFPSHPPCLCLSFVTSRGGAEARRCSLLILRHSPCLCPSRVTSRGGVEMFLVLASLCASCHLTRRRGDADGFSYAGTSCHLTRRRGGVFWFSYPFAFPVSRHAPYRRTQRRGGAEVFAAHASSFPASRHASGEFTRRREAAEVDGL
jgi:hypothetical protein